MHVRWIEWSDLSGFKSEISDVQIETVPHSLDKATQTGEIEVK